MYGDLNIDIVRERIESLQREARHERLLREATLLLVFGSRPSIRRELLTHLGMSSKRT